MPLIFSEKEQELTEKQKHATSTQHRLFDKEISENLQYAMIRKYLQLQKESKEHLKKTEQMKHMTESMSSATNGSKEHIQNSSLYRK